MARFHTVRICLTLLSLTPQLLLAASYNASKSGNWSDPATWGGAGVPRTGDNARISVQNTTVTADVAAIGEILILERNTVINLATNLTMSAGLRIGGGGYASGPGLVRTYGYSITTPYMSFGDWGYGLMEVGPGTTLTAAYITDQNQGSRMTVAHAAGRPGLTFVIPNPNIQSNFRLTLNFDPLSRGTDWAFRWQGSRKAAIDGWLGNGRMAYTGVQSVRVIEETNGYTYVYGVAPLLWSGLCASNITDVSASANAKLSVGGYSNAFATLYWGTNDLGQTHAGWMGTNVLGTVATGLVGNAAMTGLAGDTTYFYRFYGTNSELRTEGWSAAASLKTAAAPEVNNSTGATVTAGQAVLRGELAAGNVADVYIYWGREDGGTTRNYENVVRLPNTPQGAFQATVNVGYGYPAYYYVCFASNAVGTAWSPASTNFTMPQPVAMPPAAGLVCWYDAGSGVTSDGTGVSTWADRSGQGHNATRANGAPALATGQVNGRPVVRFRGNDDWFNAASAMFVKEQYLVMKAPNATWSNYGGLLGRTSGRGSNYLTENGNTSFHGNQSPEAVSRNGTALASPFSVAPINQYMLVKIRVNNNATSSALYQVGRADGYSCEWDAAEIIGYSAALSTSDENKVGSYLAQKYGLTTVYPPATGPATLTNAPVTGLTTNAATLNAVLNARGWSFDVYAYWGTRDGGPVAADWGASAFIGTFHSYSGTVSHAVADLAQRTTHYYAFYVTNAVTNFWASPSGRFDTVGPVTSENGAATGVTQTRATLAASLAAGGQGELRVYWGLADGGTNAAAWQNTNSLGVVLMGTYQATVPVLAGAPYYYRAYAVNDLSEDWADATAAFVTPVPAVALSTLPATPVAEPAGQATVTATLSAPSVSNVTVQFSFAGDAARDTDYAASAESVVIAAGSVSGAITLTGIEDALQEEDETATVGIAGLVHATNGAPASVGPRITSDDPQVTNAGGATAVTQNSAALNGVLAMGDSASVRIYWGASDGGTVAGDWDAVAVPGTRNEEAAFSTNVTGLLANRTYYYRCYATNASALAEDWADATASFNTAVPSIRVGDVTVMEGDAGGVDAVFTLTLSTPSATDASVLCATADGSATAAGADYEPTNAVVTIPAGQLSATFVARVRGDEPYETPDETFFVNLTAPTACTVADAQGVGTIRDDDLAVHLAAWRYRMKIHFSGYRRPGVLTNFPALVMLRENGSGFSYGHAASPTGGDLRFADAEELVLLKHEVERWDPSGDSPVWVQVPRLEPTNTMIWAYWGNPAETNAPAFTTNGTAWAGFHQVYHMAQPGARDSSTYRLHGTGNAAVSSTNGLVGQALDFREAGSGAVTLPFYDRNTAPYTLSAWIKTTDPDGAILGWIFYEPQDHILMQTLGGKLRFYRNWWTSNSQMLSPSAINDGQWHYCVAQRAANDAGRLFIDGVQVASVAAVGTTRGGGSSFIGRTKAEPYNIGVPSDYYFNGLIDEVRVADAHHSADWIWASWMNVASNSVFSTMQRVGPTDGPLLLIR